MTNILDKKSLAVFVCAGDPDIKTSGKIALEAVLAGADLLQIGIPFSDPVAEDPIIQSATARALKIGVKVDEIFEMVNSLQAKTDVPVIFSVYLNTVFKYGYEEFFKNCAKSNVVGVIIPDLPLEEKDEVSPFAKKYNVALVPIVTAVSKNRIELLAKNSDGLIYVVSAGLSGDMKEIQKGLDNIVSRIKKVKPDTKCILSCEIETPKEAKIMIKSADGIVCGNEIIRLSGKYGENCLPYVRDFVKSIKEAI